VFSLYGYVEKVIRYKQSVDVHACIRFTQREMQQELFMNFKEKYIYDDHCELELWRAHSRDLRSRGAYEANPVTASSESKKTYEILSDFRGWGLGANSLLPQLQISENEEVMIEYEFTAQTLI